MVCLVILRAWTGLCLSFMLFFFKQKTAYEMRISDWSSDVCSSDLWSTTAIDISESRLARLRDNLARTHLAAEVVAADALVWTPEAPADDVLLAAPCSATGLFRRPPAVLPRLRPGLVEVGRMRDVEGKRCSLRVDLGGRRVHKQQISKIL